MIPLLLLPLDDIQRWVLFPHYSIVHSACLVEFSSTQPTWCSQCFPVTATKLLPVTHIQAHTWTKTSIDNTMHHSTLLPFPSKVEAIVTVVVAIVTVVVAIITIVAIAHTWQATKQKSSKQSFDWLIHPWNPSCHCSCCLMLLVIYFFHHNHH